MHRMVRKCGSVQGDMNTNDGIHRVKSYSAVTEQNTVRFLKY
jgi:hypothetical protein